MATAEIYRGPCESCNCIIGPVYIYTNGLRSEILCEDCLLHCECGDLALSDDHDFCDACEEKHQKEVAE